MQKDMLTIIRELRQDHDLFQNNLAPQIGLKPKMYNKYENGVHPLPLRVAIKLADLYDVSLDYIARRTNSMTGVAALNQNVVPDYTTGELLDDVLRLNAEDRRDVVKYIRLLNKK